jgi:transcriptional regulator with XRE-family HTH domain
VQARACAHDTGRSLAGWYLIGYHLGVDAARLIREIRTGQGLGLRELARRAGTSHATLAAYEAGRKVPSVATLDRIVRAAGCELDVRPRPAVGGTDPAARGRELIEVLELAAMFPARVTRTLEFPRFGRKLEPVG